MKKQNIKQSLATCKSVVVVGSSPLLLLSAIALAKSGKRVSVVSEFESWGGSWQYTDHKKYYTDTACHLLESYEVSHKILHFLGIDLKPLEENRNPVRFVDDSRNKNGHLSFYHSRKTVAVELYQRTLHIFRLFVRLIVLPARRNTLSILAHSLSDFRLFFRYRLWQILTLESIHMPPHGWPTFLRSITSQLYSNRIKVIDDFVASISKNDSSIHLKTLNGLELSSDLVVMGQSTVLQGDFCSSQSLGSILSVFQSESLKKYPHFLVKVIGLPGELEIPSYIHLPADPLIHRITPSFVSAAGNQFMLVQVRLNDVNVDEICGRVLKILNSIASKISPGFSGSLEISICDKYEPLSFNLSDRAKFEPGYYDGIIVLRTIGDLSRNIAFYHGSLFSIK